MELGLIKLLLEQPDICKLGGAAVKIIDIAKVFLNGLQTPITLPDGTKLVTV